VVAVESIMSRGFGVHADAYHERRLKAVAKHGELDRGEATEAKEDVERTAMSVLESLTWLPVSSRFFSGEGQKSLDIVSI